MANVIETKANEVLRSGASDLVPLARVRDHLRRYRVLRAAMVLERKRLVQDIRFAIKTGASLEAVEAATKNVEGVENGLGAAQIEMLLRGYGND